MCSYMQLYAAICGYMRPYAASYMQLYAAMIMQLRAGGRDPSVTPLDRSPCHFAACIECKKAMATATKQRLATATVHVCKAMATPTMYVCTNCHHDYMHQQATATMYVCTTCHQLHRLPLFSYSYRMLRAPLFSRTRAPQRFFLNFVYFLEFAAPQGVD